jgi:CspA family cold shock protein
LPVHGGRNVATGTVEWMNPKRGYGYISPDAGGKDLRVYCLQIDAELVAGDRVEFVLEESDERLRDASVSRCSLLRGGRGV